MANVAYPGGGEAITLDATDQIVTFSPNLFKQGPVILMNFEVVSGVGVQLALDEAIGVAHVARVPGANQKVTFSYNVTTGSPVVHIKGTAGDKVVFTY